MASGEQVNYTYDSLNRLAAAVTSGSDAPFLNWSDGGAQSHTITVPPAAATITANYGTSGGVATPAFSPAGGTYSSSQTVTISTATSGASIRYTTDGSTPTSSTGTVYSGAITVSSSLTLKAIAYKSGLTDSTVNTAVYSIGGGGGGPAWYNASWSYRKPVTIDHTKVSGGSSLSNFPIVFSVTDANLKTAANGGGVGKSDGTDILFTSSDGITKLDHELENYTGSTGQVIAWVRIPTLSSSADTVIYIYYGNAAAADQQNKTGVWDSNYKGVWHLRDGSTLSAADSSANAQNGVIHSAAAAGGKLGGAAGFSAGSNIDLGGGNSGSDGTPGSLDVAVFTMEGWILANSANVYRDIYGPSQNGGVPQIRLTDTNKLQLGKAYFLDLGQSNATVSAGAWHHVAVSYTATGDFAFYVDGAASGGGTNLVSWGYAWNAHSWQLSSNFQGNQMLGSVDEWRVSGVVRSAGWIGTEYNNQNSPGTFVSVGAQQTSGGGGGAVLMTITSSPAGQSLTVDGVNCTAPCSYSWTAGSSHTIAANDPKHPKVRRMAETASPLPPPPHTRQRFLAQQGRTFLSRPVREPPSARCFPRCDGTRRCDRQLRFIWTA